MILVERHLGSVVGKYSVDIILGCFSLPYPPKDLPGRFLSDNSLYGVISSVLSAFSILPIVGEEKVVPQWTTGLVQ